MATRRTTKVMKQRGRSVVKKDKKLHALKPGRRVAKSGRKYTETRKNRSDTGGERAKLGTKKAV